MIGAGIFAAIGPAAAAAGSGLLIGLAVAGAVAYCNASSSAVLAAEYPASGGTYVYGRQRLGAFWGYLAGWGFVVGKTASCAAMALTVGAYIAPGWQRPIAIAAVAVLTAVNYRGVSKTVALTRWIVVVVLAALVVIVFAGVFGGAASADRIEDVTQAGWRGVLQSAGLLFFAFAGYARIATLGEEVREPARTIPVAIPLALGITLIVYLVVATTALASVGPEQLAASPAPLAAVVRAGSFDRLAVVARVGGAVAALGVLLSLIAGVSRTIFAMASDCELPRGLAAVHPRHAVPYRAELLVGALVVVLVATADLRHSIGFSSFCVLTYYAIANASAWTLPAARRRAATRLLAGAGIVGCATLAVTLPWSSVMAGSVVLLLGAAVYVARHRAGPAAFHRPRSGGS